MRLSVIIPCYNEARDIPQLLERFASALQERTDIELILVNNGSTDDTAAVLTELLPRYPFVHTVTVTKNQGYGAGILSGLKAAQGEYLGWMHADLQTDPADVLKAYALLEQKNFPEAVFIKGHRTGRPLVDTLFTLGMSIFESLYLRARLWDINAQPTIFHRSSYMTWETPPQDFALDLYAFYMARKQRLTVLRFPVRFPPRTHGTSHWNTSAAAKWKFIVRTLAFSRTLKKRRGND